LKQLPITTPLGRKAITAAKFIIAIILFTSLLLFSSRITAQEYVEFSVNEGINLSNALVRVSSNGSSLDLLASELLSLNQTIAINLSSIDIPKIGVVYVDLISNGEVIDSRKIVINNNELSLMT